MFSNNFGPHRNVECGLITIVKIDEYDEQPRPVPLLKVDVEASVVHAVAQVQITQVFKNTEENPIEAIYYFPVDSSGAVTHFEAQIENRRIKGVVKPHEEAEQQYKKAVENRQTAFLGSESKADIFKVNVGYLKPGVEAKIIVGYTTEVLNEKDSDTMRFFVPTTVAPRYIPPGANDAKTVDLKNMKFSASSPAPLSIKVVASIQGKMESLTSPTHKIGVRSKEAVPEKPNWTKAVVELVGSTTDMDRDFVLLIKPAEKQKPRLYVERLEDSVAVMAHFIPSFKLTEQPVELIFVLDRSGSMQGKSITLAKKALQLFLHSLPMDCYFNVVGFGSTYEFLFPKSAKYDDGSLKKAVQHAKVLEANLGGTEILAPLKQIYTLEPVRGYLRQIFVLTDGEVGNTEEVLGLTKAKAHECRVFSLGIGDSASHELVDGIAKAGNGTSAFVTYNESINDKVLGQLKDAMQPSLTDVQIEWTGVPASATAEYRKKPQVNQEKTLAGYGKPVEEETETDANAEKSYYQSPDSIPPIFDGSQLVVFGIFRKPLAVPTGIKITAESPDGPLTLNVGLSAENELGSTGMIHKLASVKLIREMELKVAALGLNSWRQDGHSEADKAKEKSLKKQIVSMATREGITSKYTSFIAVDTADESRSAENWVMQTRYVPSQYAHGWHGGASAPMFLSAPMACPSAPLGGMGGMVQHRGLRFSAFSAAPLPPPVPPILSRSSRRPAYEHQNLSPANACFGVSSGKTFSSPSFGGSTFSSPSFGGSTFSSPSFGGSTFSSPSFGGSKSLRPESQAGSQSNCKRKRLDESPGSLPLFAPSSPSYSRISPSNSPCSDSGSPLTVLFSSYDETPFNDESPLNESTPDFVFGRSPPTPYFTLTDSPDDEFDDPSPTSRKCNFMDTSDIDSLRPKQSEPVDKLESILSYQSFDGSFRWESGLLSAIDVGESAAEAEAKSKSWDLKAWVTALVLAYFEKHLASDKTSWELVALKARKWLQSKQGAAAESMLQAAPSFLQ